MTKERKAMRSIQDEFIKQAMAKAMRKRARAGLAPRDRVLGGWGYMRGINDKKMAEWNPEEAQAGETNHCRRPSKSINIKLKGLTNAE